MRYEAQVWAYDMFGQVQVSATLWRSPLPSEEARVPLLRTSTTLTGTGEPDEREWLRDALVGLMETL